MSVLPGWPSQPAAATEPSTEKVNILIVDDLPEKLLVFGTVLEELDQNLIYARSGKDALREVLQREFAVILLDVNMPDLDGFETAAMIRDYQRSAHTPIIFITSYADEMQTSRGYSLGAVDYIQSPVVPEVLRSKVRVFVALHAMQRQVRRQADDRAAMMAAEAARQAAERNDRRSAYLSHASRVLGGSLDEAVGVDQLAALVVPRLAPLAVVLLADDEVPAGSATVAAGQGADGPPELRPVPLVDLAPLLRTALQRAIADRRQTTLPVPPAAPLLEASFGLGAARDRPLPARSVTAVPLLSGDRVLGALLTADAADADGLSLQDLAGRAATAFENARLYRSLQNEIVERRAAEAELQAANQRKDEFLAMLSHELRNPLAAIRSALEVIRRVTVDEPKVSWASEVLHRQLRQMTRLIEELLDVARISQNKIVLAREPVDLNAVIAHGVETARPYVEERQQTLTVSQPDEPIWLQGDFSRLTQIVSNLLHNASKYSGKGTLIELRSSVDEAGAVISVRDHGMGIDAALLPRIFDLFAQGERGLDRAQGGLGVGLTLAMRLAQLHGGDITAHSAGVDRGAEFRVHLPCLRLVHGKESPGVAAPAEPPVAARRVLVVDDNGDAARSMAMLLELGGHAVRTAADGEQALLAAAEFVPEVVILDIGLPLLDGYEVARRMRKMPQLHEVLLVAVSGYGQREDRAAALAAGFDHHFVKPADPELIAACIAAPTRARPPGAARAGDLRG